MKRNLILSATLLAFLLVLAGCSSQTGVSPSGAAANGAQQSGRSRQPDFGQPQRTADIRGVVTSIIGNQVTVLKIDLNSNRRASSTSDTANGSTTASSPSLSLNLGGAGSRGGAGRPDGGPAGGGFNGGNRGGTGGSGQADRTTMIANLKAMSTGQETIIIPVGIKMMKSSVNIDTKKREMVEATLTDVTADKMITVWFNSSVVDKKVADFVLIN